MSDTTIYTASKIVTMHSSNPVATAVAVRDGRVLAVGSLEECQAWGPHVLDERYADSVLLPGFIEAHGHTMDALNTEKTYVGYFDYPLADGSTVLGITSTAALIARLKEIEADLGPNEILLANGLDPIFFPGEPRLTCLDLDEVSTTRQIFIRHASGHLATVNSALMEAEGITRDSVTPGVGKDESGEPNGELREPPAMSLASRAFREMQIRSINPGLVRTHAEMARNAGVTTSTELVGLMLLLPQQLEAWHEIVDAPDFPGRMVLYNLPSMPGTSADYDAMAEAFLALQKSDTAKMRNGGVKLIIDGSIQGWTAKMQWPGYFSGEDNAHLLTTPEELKETVKAFHRRRININAHCNGNAATEIFLDAVEDALIDFAWLDHRHVVQHSQTATSAQYRRMAKLGVCANIFTNHIWYWGDQHSEITMGPDRVRSMWACRTALDAGVSISLHTDSGVTPIGHLMTMWCAVNRITPSGRVLGEAERISPYEALYAATLGAAYQLHLDHEIGSIETGKRADFAVVDSSPLDVDPLAIRDIKVFGIVVGGDHFEAPQIVK